MLTRDEFQTIYDQGPDAVFLVLTVMHEQIAALQAEVAALRERLDKDSHNSHKPPSSDGLSKKPVSLRPQTGRKPGGQKGHEGSTLALSDTPDTVVFHTPRACSYCGTALDPASAQETGHRRQVLDLPPLRLCVTEHRTAFCCCPTCGEQNTGTFPAAVTQLVQYGSRLAGLAVYLSAFQLLPVARIATLFAEVFAAPLSTGTIATFTKRAASRLAPVAECIRQHLRTSPVVHCDETGLRIAGRLHWLHSAGTATLTYYFPHAKRGTRGMDAADILPHFAGTLVHDGWASYAGYSCRHALCNAHHLRELTALSETGGQEWAKAMGSLLSQMHSAVERANAEGQFRLPVLQEARFEGEYRRLLKVGWKANPPPSLPSVKKRGKVKQSAARNLLTRLEQGEEAVLRFLHDFTVPFDNNLSERDVRMMKVKQKVSGCFRAFRGAEAFCLLRSYVSTMKKQGQPLLVALQHVCEGNPLQPNFMPE
jgi:transposase